MAIIKPLMLLLTILSISVRAGEIQEFNQHFQDSKEKPDHWMFVPKENVKDISLSDHPGFATIRQAGKGKDIKGILKEPIRLSDHKMPWEFQMCLPQSFDAMVGVGAVTQANYAIGMNVTVTFSDPSTWPKDRTKMPEDARTFQLMVVHLGTTGESGQGLPQFTTDPHPETYLVWGRGDLGYSVMGDWAIPSVWVGDGGRRAGPASDLLYFRCRVINETFLQVGIKFDASYAFNLRNLDVSKYGKITGIWEIGPIFSCDRWIPDVLCRNLRLMRGWHAANDLKSTIDDKGQYRYEWIRFNETPDPEPPNPKYEFHVDYCVFFPSTPVPLEELSDDFNIPGYLAKWQCQPQGTIIDTHSNPGFLTMTLIGTGSGTGFGPVGGSELDLSIYKPPFEAELSFIAPDDSIPWNLGMNWQVFDEKGAPRGFWQPTVQNFPKEKRHQFVNRIKQDAAAPAPDSVFNVEFDTEPPESLMTAKPLHMLLQIIDSSHVRVGFRAKKDEPWYFSKIFDCSKALDGAAIGKLGQNCWSTMTGPRWGAPPGSPAYQRFLIDEVQWRYGLSE